MSADTTAPSWRYGQFVLGPRPVERLHEWKQFVIGQSYHLAAHPGLNVTRARSGEMAMKKAIDDYCRHWGGIPLWIPE